MPHRQEMLELKKSSTLSYELTHSEESPEFPREAQNLNLEQENMPFQVITYSTNQLHTTVHKPTKLSTSQTFQRKFFHVDHDDSYYNQIINFLFSNFYKHSAFSIEDFLSFKHRRKLINERKNYCTYATNLNTLGILLTMLIAEKQIEDGLSMIDPEVELDNNQCWPKVNTTNWNETDRQAHWSRCLDYAYDPGHVTRVASLMLSITTIALLYFTGGFVSIFTKNISNFDADC